MAKLSPLNVNSRLFETLIDSLNKPVVQGPISHELTGFLNQLDALRVQIGSDRFGIDVQTDGTVRIGDGVTNYVEFGTDGLIRGATSLWWDAMHLCGLAAAPGASGATWTAPDANTLGGYQLNAAGEKLYFSESITSTWDEESDLQFRVNFEVNVDNTGGADEDTVDMQLICYYKAHEAIVNKTQTLEVATTVGKSPQYKRWVTIFNIDWDAVGNVVAKGDKIAFILNLETDTSEVDDIIVNNIMFRYKKYKIDVEA